MPRYVKIERGIISKDKFDAHVPAHVEYVHALQNVGRYAESGYWKGRGGGMLIFDATNLEEAQEIVDNDPLIKNGCVEYELHEWCRVVEA